MWLICQKMCKSHGYTVEKQIKLIRAIGTCTPEAWPLTALSINSLRVLGRKGVKRIYVGGKSRPQRIFDILHV